MFSLGPLKTVAFGLLVGLVSVKFQASNLAFLLQTTNNEVSVQSENDVNIDQCLQLLPGLDLGAWPDIIYHKDANPNVDRSYYLKKRFSSVEEDDKQARQTVKEFNAMRPSVLTRELVESGFAQGDSYRAEMFANRLVQASIGKGQPLTIAVFGSSFTNGHSCAESSAHMEAECAWPTRLARRWTDVLAPLFCVDTNADSCGVVQWRFFQEGSQGSTNIAQKLHAILDEFSSKNTTPDAILLDNSIIDLENKETKPWFEAVVRVLAQSYPNAVIVSLIDGIPNFAEKRQGIDFVGYLHKVQKHYGLVSLDISRMVQILRQKSSIDLLWPQTPYLISQNGTAVTESVYDSFRTMHWANFRPKVRVAKESHRPNIHAPWPTHQYVADAVLYSMLRVIQFGLGCSKEDKIERTLPGEDTVAQKDLIDSCDICLQPITQIDAKSLLYAKDDAEAYADNTTDDNISSMVSMCGDWRLIHDKKPGWQSDQQGSLIRFRLKLSIDGKPNVAMTYMRSHSTFGSLMLSFHVVDKDETPILECGDNDINQDLLPWLQLSGKRQLYSLWDTVTFSADQKHDDAHSKGAMDMFNNTVLSQVNASYVDLYVFNPNESARTSRIKIQTVTSC